MQKFIIDGRLNGLNELINANKENRFKGDKLKKDNETVVIYYARKHKIKPITKYPIAIHIYWYESNRRRDIDNVESGIKFILDGLQKDKILKNDGQKYIYDIKHHFNVDRDNPRVEVHLIERGD